MTIRRSHSWIRPEAAVKENVAQARYGSAAGIRRLDVVKTVLLPGVVRRALLIPALGGRTRRGRGRHRLILPDQAPGSSAAAPGPCRGT